jgi:hypothetical protein
LIGAYPDAAARSAAADIPTAGDYFGCAPAGMSAGCHFSGLK